MQLKYKNFIAEIYYISRTGCFYGEVINCQDLIVFHAENNNNLESVFIIAVEQYLCYLEKSFSVNPNQSYLATIKAKSIDQAYLETQSYLETIE